MKRIVTFAFLLIFLIPLQSSAARGPVTPETALRRYINNGDKSLTWKIDDQTAADGVRIFRIIFTSQQWREHKWNHELTLIVPDNLYHRDALLFITGGSVREGKPRTHKWDESLTVALSDVAKTNRAITAILWQVPNQPLYESLTEDALISFTLHNYLDDNDFSWPLLFPMTKSAVRAMDVIQKFAKKVIRHKVSNFVVSGASKRGWTSWLTGASDKRVKAIAPMVIDVLNMPLNVDYHKVSWGDYSVEIQDYVDLGIAQQMGTPGGMELVTMVDPYSYRKSLTMPKMIFMGTNDPYWPVDAVKNYIDSIPGTSFICYTPDAGHDLGDKKKAFATLSAFFGTSITNGKYPICNYTISESEKGMTLRIEATPELLLDAILWTSTSEDRDFRDEKWSGTSLNKAGQSEIAVEIPKPESGFKAFYVDLKYKAPFKGEFTQSTRMFLTTGQKLLLQGN